MRENFYLRFGERPGDDCEWGIAGDDIRSLKTRRASLSQALTTANVGGRRIIAFVPASDCRMVSVNIPARQPAKVLQAVPYALEDQVADNIETLHFAIGPRQDDGAYPVTIVSQERMGQWLDAFKSNGVQASALVPDCLALQADDETWSALAAPDQLTVRNGKWSFFSCAPDDLLTYLELASPEDRTPLRLNIAGAADRDWSTLDWPVTLLPSPSGLSALANAYVPGAAINLLQGQFANTRNLDKVWQPWKLAASLLIGLGLISGANFALESAQQARALELQEAENLARFRELFPSESRIVNLEVQLNQQLRKLDSQGGRNGPLDLLEVLAHATRANPGLKLKGVQYREGALSLSMTASELGVLEKLRNWFDQNPEAGLEVQSANAESDGVQIRARMTGA